MKFQLFGRLRDDESSPSNGSTSTSSSSVPESSGLGGGSLDRTVERMFSQGYSEEEIITELGGQYSETEISSAINQAVKSSATGDSLNEGPEPMQPYGGEDQSVSPMDEGFNDDTQEQQEMSMDKPEQPQQNDPSPPPLQNSQQPQDTGSGNQGSIEGSPGSMNSSTEELVETIVAENFEMVEREFENVYREIGELKDKAQDLEERVHDLEVRDDEDQTQFIQKMDDIEEDINSYQSRIGGLEKAFQQVLPSLVDNVRDLTDLVQEIKQERGIETSSNLNKEDIEDMDMEDW